MKSRRFLLFAVSILLLLSSSSLYAHTISSSLGHSYSSIYVIIYFASRVLPFFGLGILANYPARQLGYSRMFWAFITILGIGILLGYLFHDYLSTSYFNYFLTVGIGVLMIFYAGKFPLAIRSIIVLCCLPLGFDFGMHFNHADAWLGYMIAILLFAIAAFMGMSKLFMKRNNHYLWVQQTLGGLLVMAGVLLILLF